jgi:hypothetical protein
MDLNKMLSELRSYRAAIDQAILALEGLASGARRGPGRPAKMDDERRQPQRNISQETSEVQRGSPTQDGGGAAQGVGGREDQKGPARVKLADDWLRRVTLFTSYSRA